MTAGIFAIVILATAIVAVVWDLNSNPYRIEEHVMGVPPRKLFFIYARGWQIRSEAHFESREKAEEWIKQAKEVARA